MVNKFPKNFFWGAATASHQVEGNTHNNWSVWEKKKAKGLAKEYWSRYWWIRDFKLHENETRDPNNYISGKGVEHYKRYKEDLKLTKEIGLNAYRFSIEWSRIEPKKGKFVEKEILHYVKKIKYMRSIGIEPFVSIWHWTHPVWLEKEGGVLSPNFKKYIVRYTENLFKYLGNDVKYWITVNEPEVYAAQSFLVGNWPPQERSIMKTWRVFFNLSRVHNSLFKAIKRNNPHAWVTFAKHNTAIVRGDKGLLTTLSVLLLRFIKNDLWFLLTKNHFDYIGLNNYTRDRIVGSKLKNLDIKVNDLGWELYPDSVYQCLVDLKKYNKPIVVTENGLADSRDKHRAWYIKEVINGMRRAINEGVDLRGYLHWSLLDNFEWAHGYWPKFGLIEVDKKTQKRSARKSSEIYSKLIAKESI